MKKLLMAAVALVAMAAPTLAADIAVKAPLLSPAPIANWSGFFIGAHVGAGWMDDPEYRFADPGNAAFASCGPCVFPYSSQVLGGNSDASGVAGLHVGYNWQFAPTWLVGIEGDVSWSGARSSANSLLSTADFANINGSSLTFSTDIDWLATIRGRLGYVAGNWLLYVTGGIAFADIQHSANAACPVAVAGPGATCVFTSGMVSPFSVSDTKAGWVLGAGAEWQFAASNWRARIEYLYYAFDGESGAGPFVAVPGGGPLPCIVTPTCSAQYSFGDVRLHTLRAGLSYAWR